jgi:HSP20 family protein
MKLDINKWNPFKFGRRSRESTPSRPQQHQQQQGSPGGGATQMGGSSGGGMPQAWLDPQGLPEPMRMMGDFLRDPFGSLMQTDRWFGDFSPAVFQPRIDVVDDGEALRVTAELPGMDSGDVEILIEDEYLILRGEKKLEKKNEEQGCYHVERAFGSFQRIIPLPQGVDVERGEARFENGTLTIRFPKVPAAQSGSKKLEINSSGSASSPQGSNASKASAR